MGRRVILCGFNWTGCCALEKLIGLGAEVFVYTHIAPYHIPDLAALCVTRNVPYSLENISKAELPFQPDLICSIYYRYLIKTHVINSCHGRIFNLHPSLLPKYRGCSSLTWALINGESECGFTYHYVDDGCDTGNIIIQRRVPIADWDTQQTLYTRVMFESMNYFEDSVELVLSGMAGAPQKGDPSYFKRGCPYNGEIDESWDTTRIERFIRAMCYPPYPPATFRGESIFTIDDYHRCLQTSSHV